MTHSIDRRGFLAGSVAAAAVVGIRPQRHTPKSPSLATEREFYELRRYRIESRESQSLVLEHLETALVPALGRAGLDRIGVFAPSVEGKGYDLHLLLPFARLAQLGELDGILAGDAAFADAARPFYQLADTHAAYTRIESRLLQAFGGMPTIEVPQQTRSKSARIFELRTYQSRTANSARLKVEMFNRGEIQLMRDVGLGPVFYGAGRIGSDVPSLTYMLSADDSESHAEHWKAFLAHAKWAELKAIPRYASIVSKIHNEFLSPANCSQL